MTIRRSLGLAIAVALTAAACSESEDPADSAAAAAPETEVGTMASAPSADAPNPFFAESTLYLQYPHFDRIGNEHYAPAFERGMAQHLTEIETIAGNAEAPTFDNTLVALERSGQLLDRVSRVFFAMASAHTNDEIEAVRSEMAPKLAAHRDAILLNAELFTRMKALHEQLDELELDDESRRLVKETYKQFVRAGAELDESQKMRLKEINSELATLQTQFSQNVLAEVNENAIVVDDAARLAGMTEAEIAAAAKAAEARELAGKYVIPLLNTTGQPALASLEDRTLRRRIMETSLARGSSGGEYDNREELTRVATLRAERADLLGYDNHAAYSLEDQTARTVEAVNERLAALAPAAVANARMEAEALQQMIDADGADFELAPWDWSYYTEKVRKQKFDFDESQLKPYFELDNVLVKGVFHAAEKVYGLTFEQRTDLPTYQEDVRVWEVFDADGSTLGLFIEDM